MQYLIIREQLTWVSDEEAALESLNMRINAKAKQGWSFNSLHIHTEPQEPGYRAVVTAYVVMQRPSQTKTEGKP